MITGISNSLFQAGNPVVELSSISAVVFEELAAFSFAVVLELPLEFALALERLLVRVPAMFMLALPVMFATLTLALSVALPLEFNLILLSVWDWLLAFTPTLVALVFTAV